ncbi:MAG: uracil-DNA glycosylase [Gemmatimonadales bacterium]
MDARLVRYLQQQVELGGAEVILPAQDQRRPSRRRPATAEPLTVEAPIVSATAAADSTPAPHPQDATITVPSVPPTAASPATPEPGKWRKGAPAIPGPGLTVHPPCSGPIVSQLESLTTLELVAAHIAACRRCQLCETRTNTVPGEGNPRATLMLVGEGPGETEDQTGRPFVGKAGQLLDQMLAAIDCPRSSVFIANIVKCRPPGNRKPLPDESAACLPSLHRQIALVRPVVLLALGGTAAEALLGVKQPLGALRLQVHRYGTTPLIVTYHPAALLRNPNWKKPAWDDVRIARQLLDQHD